MLRDGEICKTKLGGSWDWRGCDAIAIKNDSRLGYSHRGSSRRLWRWGGGLQKDSAQCTISTPVAAHKKRTSLHVEGEWEPDQDLNSSSLSLQGVAYLHRRLRERWG